MFTGTVVVREHAGRLDDIIDIQVIPGKVFRVTLSEGPDGLPVDDEGSLDRLDPGPETSVNGVVFQQIGKTLGRHKIIDCNEFQVRIRPSDSKG
jgi:hypothetical protein